MLRIHGILKGEGEPIDVEVLINPKTAFSKMPDLSGKIISPHGRHFTVGEKFLLAIPGASEANIGLPEDNSVHIVIDKAAENYLSFSQTVPPR